MCEQKQTKPHETITNADFKVLERFFFDNISVFFLIIFLTNTKGVFVDDKEEEKLPKIC